ncbi:MAG: phosphoribosylanthranilate isomerase [Prolixibacteraceae bacterium]
MIVKVCGMGDPAIMHQLSVLEIDLLGFIFYPRSPRFVEGKIDPEEIDQLPSNIKKAGVFVNADEEYIVAKAKEFHMDTLQLHGSESPELCSALKQKGYQIMKAFNLTKKNDYKAYETYCDFFLFDTPSEKHGGTGEKFDWTLLDTYQGETPFLLSGGIGPNDAEEILQINHPKMAGIDINSKFEVQPGIKDRNKILIFLKALKGR